MNTNSTEKEPTGYPSVDKPWLKYYSEEAINAPLPECTIYEYLFVTVSHNFKHLFTNETIGNIKNFIID